MTETHAGCAAKGLVAFPLLIDRNISATAAAATSVKAVLRNPLTMALRCADRLAPCIRRTLDVNLLEGRS